MTVPTNKLPLSRLRVMVTRPLQSRDALADRLRDLGAQIVMQPAICIGPPVNRRPMDAVLSRLDEFNWLVFLSVNGVRYFLDSMQPSADAIALSRLNIAAIGPGTAAELARRGLHATLVPENFDAEALAEALAPQAAGKQVLIARASRGREVLAEQLAAAGATVEQVVVYSSTDVDRPEPGVLAMLRAGQIDWITITSSAIARSLARLFGDDLRRAKLASISPITSDAVRGLGYAVAAEARESTFDALADAIVRYDERKE